MQRRLPIRPGRSVTREGPYGLASEPDTHGYNDPVEKGEAILDALDDSKDPDHSERDQKPPRAGPIHVAYLPRPAR